MIWSKDEDRTARAAYVNRRASEAHMYAFGSNLRTNDFILPWFIEITSMLCAPSLPRLVKFLKLDFKTIFRIFFYSLDFHVIYT